MQVPRRTRLTGKTRSRWKYLFIPMILAVVLSIGVGLVVYGATSTNVNLQSTVTVTEGSANIAAYADSGCTIPLAGIDFGDIQKGTSSSNRNIWIRNNGTVPISIACSGATGLGTGLTFNNDASPLRTPVSPNDVALYTVSLSVGSTASTGTDDFSIDFTGTVLS